MTAYSPTRYEQPFITPNFGTFSTSKSVITGRLPTVFSSENYHNWLVFFGLVARTVLIPVAMLGMSQCALSVDGICPASHCLIAFFDSQAVSPGDAENKPNDESNSSVEIPLAKVPDPPLVKMLLPGFSVHELPVDLTNLNNVRARRDGKLVTLGYDGDIHLLSDTNGDDIEDSKTVYWKNQGSIRGPIGMVLTPEGYPHGQGVLLASKGKVSMIVDRNGDDVGDEELIVASGWQEIPQNVDAVGLAMDHDGTLYFGLGTANYANAFLIDGSGKANYDLRNERGTVQRISADWKRRDTVCTGIRFPIAFQFNEYGDLFCTEQEGATWLPNGNPLDELLHVRLDGIAPSANATGKQHFGFPPRHPRHNPDVIDEPSVYDYGPQHQSTCGMVFNKSLDGELCFGPRWWKDDALICGESRGKLWRTKLVKTEEGYVANNQLLACLQMLTVDTCIASNGDLVVACHSGPPDWGTGPEGKGKLFRIRMNEHNAPRPVIAWWSSPGEVQIAFDTPLNPQNLRGITDKAKIEYGEHVRAGDRFENLVPPYSVVQQQLVQPRRTLPVHSMGVSLDSRTLTLKTGVISQPVNYSILLPIGENEIELDVRPCGVWASWTASSSTQARWQGYLPHIDLNVCRKLLIGSTTHDSLWPLLELPGRLSLETTIDCRNMLRPSIQPGEKLDHEWPAENVELHFTSNAPLLIKQPSVNNQTDPKASGSSLLRLPLGLGNGIARLSIELSTQMGVIPDLTISFSTAEDATSRAIPLRRFVLPFVSIDSITSDSAHPRSRPPIAELAGGRWGNGRRLFHDQRSQCAKCHTIGHGVAGSESPSIGPNLSHLTQRDYESVLRDIVEPNRAINPDFLSHTLTTTAGQVITGTVRTEGNDLVIGNAAGEVSRIVRGDVETMEATGISVMPQDLLDKLSSEERRDLLTYLLTPPPQMPKDVPLEAPPIRTSAEVGAVLSGSQPLIGPLDELNILLIDGVKDHGPGEHDYPAWQRVWAELLSGAEQVNVATVREFPDEQQLEAADILIFFQKGSFSIRREIEFDKFLKRGGGAVFIHWAVNGNDRVQQFAQRIGLASWGGRISYRHGPLSLDIEDSQHPIMRNLERLALYDESYWKLTGDLDRVNVLATSQEDGQATPQIWTRDHQPGRVFVSIPGHYSWTFDDPLFRILLLRGIAWTAQQPIDRFNALVTPGARMAD